MDRHERHSVSETVADKHQQQQNLSAYRRIILTVQRAEIFTRAIAREPAWSTLL
jgi:hypothetical protein